MKEFRISDCVWYVLVTIMSWYTAYLGVIYTVIQGIGWFIFRKRPSFRKWLWINLIIVISFIPWLVKFLLTVTLQYGILWVPPTTNYITRAAHHVYVMLFLFPPSMRNYWLNFSLVMLLLVFPLLNLRKDGRYRFELDIKKEDILLLIWLAFPFLSYFLIDKFWFDFFRVTRFFGFAHFPLFLLFAKGISKLRFRWQSLLIILIVCYTSVISLYPHYTKGRKFNDQKWASAFSAIKKISPSHSLVVTFLPVEWVRYYTGNLKVLNLDDINYAYGNEYYDSIFVIRRPGQAFFLPKYRLFKRWYEGYLKVEWYRRIRDFYEN
jgi:hypothetical protein